MKDGFWRIEGRLYKGKRAYEYVVLFYTLVSMKDALFNAIRAEDESTVATILKKQPGLVNETDQRGSTPLLLATYYGFAGIAKVILKHKPNVDAKDGSGNTPLMGVCFKGYPEIAKLLIAHGADVNVVNFNNATALIYAATFAQATIAKILLEEGADREHKDERGNTAFDHAKMQGSKALMDLLK